MARKVSEGTVKKKGRVGLRSLVGADAEGSKDGRGVKSLVPM